METHYKIELEQHPAERYVRVLLNGKFSEDALAAVERSICEAESSHRRVFVDLSEVTLVDRKAAEYLSARASNGVQLVNCPPYLRRWIPQVNHESHS
jgi:hypothetical protein